MPTPASSSTPSTPVAAQGGIWYVTRDEVMAALDVHPSGSHIRNIDTAIESSSRTVEGFLHRVFYPWSGTRYKDFPNNDNARVGRLWLDADEIISLSSLASGGVTIPPANYYLEPGNSGPPYNRIEINRATNSVLSSTDGTAQRSVAMTGVFAGSSISEATSGTLAEALTTSTTTMIINDTYIGVGSVLRVDSERMIVTARGWVTSGQSILTDLTASNANTTVSVSDGSLFAVGEILLLDSERVLITDIVNDNLIVQRAIQGTVLAVHDGSTVNWARNLTVTRAQLGTTAASHLVNATVYRLVFPGPVVELTKAYALNTLLQVGSGYARTVGPPGGGSRDERQIYAGRGLRRIEEAARAKYGRKCRKRAI